MFTISTLGFRGEALASIASVAHLSIISSNGNNEGAEFSITDGKIGDLAPAAIIGGTQVTIKDLFYNTPARKKFLKTPRTESRKIIDMVRRFGISRPNLGFSLIVDGKKVIDLYPEEFDERIAAFLIILIRKILFL